MNQSVGEFDQEVDVQAGLLEAAMWLQNKYDWSNSVLLISDQKRDHPRLVAVATEPTGSYHQGGTFV
jgi:hypothetical protein